MFLRGYLRLILFPVFVKSYTPKYIFNSVSDKGLEEYLIKNVLSLIYHEVDVHGVTSITIAIYEKLRQAGKYQYLFYSMLSSEKVKFLDAF